MGCGNGVIGVHMVRDILQAHPGANALFVCAEICSSAFYQGRDKHCLISNALFRCVGVGGGGGGRWGGCHRADVSAGA
jgi:3-ketoacyl-CoA synthase